MDKKDFFHKRKFSKIKHNMEQDLEKIIIQVIRN